MQESELQALDQQGRSTGRRPSGFTLRIAIGLAATLLVVSGSLGVYWYRNSTVNTKTGQTARSARESTKPAEPCLDEDERKLLWDIEHYGNILARGPYGFKDIATALKNADRVGLRKLMTANFTGKLLQGPREVRVKAPFAEVVRLEDSGKPALSVDQAKFVDKLLEFRKPFDRPPDVKISLMRLMPVVREKLDGLWEGTCQLRMFAQIDPADKSPPLPREVVLYLKYQIHQPTEDQLKKGSWLRSCEITQSQVAHSPGLLLRDVTVARGVDPTEFHDNWGGKLAGSSTGGVYMCDFDHDGYMDMLVTDVKRIALYKGLPGGKLQEVTMKYGLVDIPSILEPARLAVTAAFVDLDGDGWEDLILGTQIYKNEGGTRFVNVSHKSNLKYHLTKDNPSGDPKGTPIIGGLIVADYDRDGLMDIYATRPGLPKADSWLDGKSGDPKGNILLRNQGNWQFEDVTEATGTSGGNRSTFTALWLDANNDGWPDLYVPNEFGNGVLLLNNGNGTFREQSVAGEPGDFGTMGATYGNFDNSPFPSIFTNNMYSKAGGRVIGNLCPGTYSEDVMAKMRRFVTGSQLHRCLGPGSDGRMRYEPVGKRFQLQDIGWSYGAAFLDLDNDGFLDLYATCGYISQDRSKPDG